MRRKDREMPESFAFDVANRCDFATLSMIDPDTAPYGVPLQIFVNENKIYFHCATKGFKLDCLRENPQVCITCVSHLEIISEEFTTKYQSAILRGKASEIQSFQEKTAILHKIAQRYTPNHAHLAGKEIETYLNATSIWEIEISSATGKEHK